MAEKINWREINADRARGMEDDDFEEEERVYDDTFQKLKEIGKELLFSGASRTIENKNGETALELL